MIIDFSIQNYRSLKDKVTLSFEPDNSDRLEDFYIVEPIAGIKLLKLGIIYGPNGSGKTSILKALDFLRKLVVEPAFHKQEQLDYEPFLLDEASRNAPTVFELNFISAGQKYQYAITFNKTEIISERLYFYTPKKALVYERETDEAKQLANIKFGSKIKLRKAEEDTLITNTLWNATVLGSFLRSNIDSAALRNVTEWFLQVLGSIVTPDTDLYRRTSRQISNSAESKGNILLFMQKADFGIVDISFEKTQELEESTSLPEWMPTFSSDIAWITIGKGGVNKIIRLVEGIDVKFSHAVQKGEEILDYTLPYADQSQGTKRYFQFSGLLNDMLTGAKVVCIDELESSLHPDLVKHFLLLFLVNAKSSQLIATTHYRELLLEKDMLRNDVIWFTERKPDGGIDLYSLSDFDSSVIRDTSSIFNAYKSGKLGAVPALSDYYIELSNGENK